MGYAWVNEAVAEGMGYAWVNEAVLEEWVTPPVLTRMHFLMNWLKWFHFGTKRIFACRSCDLVSIPGWDRLNIFPLRQGAQCGAPLS